MLTILNRKELMSTFDMKRQAEVRNILNDHHIDYDIKTLNRKSASPMMPGSRAYTGTLGENLELEYEYTIYVKKTDYDAACELLNISGNR